MTNPWGDPLNRLDRNAPIRGAHGGTNSQMPDSIWAHCVPPISLRRAKFHRAPDGGIYLPRLVSVN